MQMCKLGKAGLEVSCLALGGNVFGWTADEAMSFKLLDAYVAAGGNFIDTADTYSRWAPGHQGGESETVIGKWLKQRGNRAKVVIATKVGAEMADRRGSKAYIWSPWSNPAALHPTTSTCINPTGRRRDAGRGDAGAYMS
jgi:aryl-alcohol dehydrogenase-like predicted oxidoreductase